MKKNRTKCFSILFISAFVSDISFAQTNFQDSIDKADFYTSISNEVIGNGLKLRDAARSIASSSSDLKSIGLDKAASVWSNEAKTLDKAATKLFDKRHSLSKTVNKGLDRAGMLISAADVTYNAYQDFEKYGYAGEEFLATSALASVDAVGKVLNRGNPLSLLGLAAVTTSFVLPDGSEFSEGLTLKNFAKALPQQLLESAGDPVGKLVDTTRLVRDTLFQVGKTDEAINSYHTTKTNAFVKLVDKDYISGGEEVAKKIIQSRNISEFKTSIQNSLSKTSDYVSKVMEMNEDDIKWLTSSKNDVSNWIPGASIRKDLYQSIIDDLIFQNKKLSEKLQYLQSNDAFVRIAEGFADAWMIAYTTSHTTISKDIASALTSDKKMTDNVISQKALMDMQSTTVVRNVISSIAQGQNSAIGSPSANMGWKQSAISLPITTAVVSQTNTNNALQQTGAQQVAQAINTIAFKASDWQVTEGNAAQHYSIGNNFGSITAPNGGAIAALNNANMQQTVMQKIVTIPTGVKQATVGMVANFVTNEYPQYVGSQFNDKAIIEIKTGSGNIYQATLYNKELNSANFKSVNGLPSPMGASGGQTGFESISKTIPVANGGQLTITVKTINVGDQAYPSATLVNSTSIK